MAIHGVTDPVANLSIRLRLAPDVVIREEDTGFILYDINRDILYQGNETGRQVLALCDGCRTVEEIIDHFSMTSGSPREEISGFVHDFLTGLQDAGLAEPV